jgi:hypothetical protein
LAASELYDAASAILHVAAGALAFSPRGTPEAAYVAFGPPPFDTGPGTDCGDSLSVHLTGIQVSPATIGQGTAVGADTLIMTRIPIVVLGLFVVEVLRCVLIVDDEGFPAPADLDAEASDLYQDGWIVWNTMVQTQREGGLVGSACTLLQVGDSDVIPAEGGVAGWRVPVTAQIDAGLG